MDILEDKIKHEIANVLELTDKWQDGTYLYWLTRHKSAFGYGTMTVDDFEEVDNQLVEDIYEAIKPYIEAKEIIIKTPELPETDVIKYLHEHIRSLQEYINRSNTRTFM